MDTKNVIEIQMLGGFEICLNGKPVLKPLQTSRKATAVMEYLILHQGEPVSHKMLIDAIWGGQRASNPDMALRAILHRVRNMIEDEELAPMRNCIVTSRGYYRWNPGCLCKVDAFTVDEWMQQAARQNDEYLRGKLYAQVLELYTGRLLPHNAGEPWVEAVSVRLHAQYRNALLGLVELCKKWGENQRIADLCARALELDPYEERLYLEWMLALQNMGREDEARLVAERGTDIGCLHRKVEPERAGSAYRQVLQADSALDEDLRALVRDLPADTETGAVMCSFDEFCTAYRVARGMQARHGEPLFLALIRITPSRGTGVKRTEDMMKQLGEVVRTALRRSDVAARRFDTQYVVLLNGSTVESGAGPLERIKTAFYRLPHHERFLLNYTLYTPESIPATPFAREHE